MLLYLDDLYKAEGNVAAGDEAGGSYIRRIVTGTTKDGRPQYRYLRSKEEVEAYDKEQGKEEGGKDSLKQKLTQEQKESKDKQGRDPTLFLKDKAKVKKSFPLYLED